MTAVIFYLEDHKRKFYPSVLDTPPGLYYDTRQ